VFGRGGEEVLALTRPVFIPDHTRHTVGLAAAALAVFPRQCGYQPCDHPDGGQADRPMATSVAEWEDWHASDTIIVYMPMANLRHHECV